MRQSWPCGRLATEHKLDYGTTSPLLHYLVLLSTEFRTLGFPLIVALLPPLNLDLNQRIVMSYKRRQTRLDTQEVSCFPENRSLVKPHISNLIAAVLKPVEPELFLDPPCCRSGQSACRSAVFVICRFRCRYHRRRRCRLLYRRHTHALLQDAPGSLPLLRGRRLDDTPGLSYALLHAPHGYHAKTSTKPNGLVP